MPERRCRIVLSLSRMPAPLGMECTRLQRDLAGSPQQRKWHTASAPRWVENSLHGCVHAYHNGRTWWARACRCGTFTFGVRPFRCYGARRRAAAAGVFSGSTGCTLWLPRVGLMVAYKFASELGAQRLCHRYRALILSTPDQPSMDGEVREVLSHAIPGGHSLADGLNLPAAADKRAFRSGPCGPKGCLNHEVWGHDFPRPVRLGTHSRRQTCCSCCPPRRSSHASKHHHIHGSSVPAPLRIAQKRMELEQRYRVDKRAPCGWSRSLWQLSGWWNWRRCQQDTGARSVCLEGNTLLKGTAPDEWSPPCTGYQPGCAREAESRVDDAT
eukprot:7379886-Prymnesium_polylepis.1